MTWLNTVAARLGRAVKRSYGRKWRFLGVFACVFGLNIVLLGQSDLLPDAPVADAAPLPAVTLVSTTTRAVVTEEPVKVEIPALKRTVTVTDPSTTNIDALNKLLLSGAVHYPTSAKLGEDGNVVLFGHSSYLPIVINQAYKTFDGIQNLHKGDTITVYSIDRAYTYAVRSVEKESTNTDGIALSVSGKVLTLATCNDFTGKKTDRFVVTADFIGSHSIATNR